MRFSIVGTTASTSTRWRSISASVSLGVEARAAARPCTRAPSRSSTGRGRARGTAAPGSGTSSRRRSARRFRNQASGSRPSARARPARPSARRSCPRSGSPSGPPRAAGRPAVVELLVATAARASAPAVPRRATIACRAVERVLTHESANSSSWTSTRGCSRSSTALSSAAENDVFSSSASAPSLADGDHRLDEARRRCGTGSRCGSPASEPQLGEAARERVRAPVDLRLGDRPVVVDQGRPGPAGDRVHHAGGRRASCPSGGRRARPARAGPGAPGAACLAARAPRRISTWSAGEAARREPYWSGVRPAASRRRSDTVKSVIALLRSRNARAGRVRWSRRRRPCRSAAAMTATDGRRRRRPRTPARGRPTSRGRRTAASGSCSAHLRQGPVLAPSVSRAGARREPVRLRAVRPRQPPDRRPRGRALRRAAGIDETAHGPFEARLPADRGRAAVPEPQQRAGPGLGAVGVRRARSRSARPGTYLVSAVTKLNGRLVAASPAQVRVGATAAVPGVGDRAIRVHTPTVASVGGNVESDRDPRPAGLHARGRSRRRARATPAGGAAVLHARAVREPRLRPGHRRRRAGQVGVRRRGRLHPHGDLRGQRPRQGRRGRSPLAWGLDTEPWLFTIDADGVVAARIEGAFSADELRDAVRKALR